MIIDPLRAAMQQWLIGSCLESERVQNFQTEDTQMLLQTHKRVQQWTLDRAFEPFFFNTFCQCLLMYIVQLLSLLEIKNLL